MKKTRTLILAIFTLLPALSFAQNIFSFVTKSDSVTTNIQALNANAFITDAGYIYFDKISRAYMHESTIPDYYKGKFADLEIPLFDSDSDVTELRTTVLKNWESASTPQEEITAQQLYNQLKEFNKARSTGYTLELLGVGVSGVGLAVEEPAASVVGAALSLIGVIVNSSAGNHLKRKSR